MRKGLILVFLLVGTLFVFTGAIFGADSETIYAEIGQNVETLMVSIE